MLLHLIEDYYLRCAPLGVAFVTPSHDVTFGRPSRFAMASMTMVDGLTQYQIESWDATVFVSTFGRGRFLIAQFPFDLEIIGAPVSFMRLASAIQRELEEPSERQPPGDCAVRVPKDPRAPRPSLRAAVEWPE